jgi:MoaA/NifB/PqqE/SkfB family radical SAM enzyme
MGKSNMLRLPRKAAKWALKKTVYRNCVFHPRKEDRPLFSRIDINDTCNLLCKECFYPDFAEKFSLKRYMPPDAYELIASRAFDYLYSLQIGCSFEPMLHPDFAEIVRITDSYSLPWLGMVTNGTMLAGEKATAILDAKSLKTVSVSNDAISPDTYKLIRGRPMLDRVLDNVVNFLAERNKRRQELPVVVGNTLVMRSNLSELPKLMEWYIGQEFDAVQFFHVEPMGRDNPESAVNVPEEYNKVHERIGAIAKGAKTKLIVPPPLTPEYFDADACTYRWRRHQDGKASEHDTLRLSRKPEDEASPYPKNVFCIFPWMGLQIDSWGNLFPCSRKQGPVFGNLIYQELDDAINNMHFLRLRRAMLAGNHEASCPGCRSSYPNSEPTQRKITCYD